MRKWLPKRLKELTAHGKNQVGLAAALNVPKTRITEIISGKRNIAATEIRPMAQYLEWPEQKILDLISGSPLRGARLGSIMVRGAVEAGAPRAAMEWEQTAWYTAPVAADARFPEGKQFGLEVRGPSMDKVYPEGTVLVCLKMIDYGKDAVPGQRVVVQSRTVDGIEATVKELRKDAQGDYWLWPLSNHPDFQTPQKLSKPDEYDTNDDVQIWAVVIGHYKPELA